MCPKSSNSASANEFISSYICRITADIIIYYHIGSRASGLPSLKWSKGSPNFATSNSSNKKTPTCPNLGRTNQANDEVKVCMCLRLRTADTLLFTSLKYLESCSNAIIYSMNHSVIHEECVMTTGWDLFEGGSWI